jgi:Flp pilus assembly protein TadG
MRFRSVVARLRKSESGQEIVEFALASTLFFGVLFAVAEGGIAVWQYNRLSNLAQDGARWAVVRGATSDGSFKTSGTYANLVSYLQAFEPGVSVTLDNSNRDPNLRSRGESITVTVSRPMPATIGFFTMSGTMRASATMWIAR